MESQKKLPLPEKYVYGINGLAELLNCSRPTAQRHKNSGKIPYYQIGNTIIFDKESVLEAISNQKTAA